jgi:hypothetical protein
MASIDMYDLGVTTPPSEPGQGGSLPTAVRLNTDATMHLSASRKIDLSPPND